MCICVCVYPRWGDGPVALQPRRVPDLSFDGEVIQLNCPRAELHTDGCAAVVSELIFGEAGQNVAFSYTRLPDQNHWKQAKTGSK